MWTTFINCVRVYCTLKYIGSSWSFVFLVNTCNLVHTAVAIKITVRCTKKFHCSVLDHYFTCTKEYLLPECYDLKLRIAFQNQARFNTKIFLERAGIDLGFPRMLARCSSTEPSKLDTSRGKINFN